MLSAFGLSEVSRTSQPAVLGTLTVIIDDLIRNTTGEDWDDWLQLKPAAAERLADEMATFIKGEHGFPPQAGEVVELEEVGGELVSVTD